MNLELVKAAARGAALAATIAVAATAPSLAADKEQCYGIAKAGQNDCGNLAGTHSCAGQSTADYDISEYKIVDAGTCSTLGGHSKQAALEIFNAQS